MIYYHGMHKKKSYFEGWYFKLQTEYETIAFIPGININKKGEKFAFIQILTDSDSYYVPYHHTEFLAKEQELYIRINNNIFSKEKILLDINYKDITLKGEIQLDTFTPIRNDIMGPFRFFPFMECNHGIISLFHKLHGSLEINGKMILFDHGTGYIETDWGISFPKSYLWIQTNIFSKKKCSIMVSIAKIPYLGMYFNGCICVVYYKNKEYRFATYHGVKILNCTSNFVRLKQGHLDLKIKIMDARPQMLLAPVRGNMSREIHESLSCTARFTLTDCNHIIFDTESKNTSYEYVSD